MNIREAQVYGRAVLKDSPSPLLDVDCILQFILSRDKTFLLFHREVELTQEQKDIFEDLLKKRQTGLPIAYITQKKEFYGRDFFVTPDVLIPKPDTELLVELSLSVIRQKLSSKPGYVLTICDMCTGSGCVGLSIINECIDQKIVNKDNIPLLIMADISQKALDIAKINAKKMCSEEVFKRILFVRSNLFEMISLKFDLIASNPPYVPKEQAYELLKDGRSEPILALDGDIDINGNPLPQNDGLGVIKNLIPQAYEHLNPYGALIIESGEYNAEKTQKLFIKAGLKDTSIEKDLNDQLRDTIGYK